MLRLSGDTIELTPPLIVSEDQIGEIMDKVAASIKGGGLIAVSRRERRTRGGL